MDGSHVRDSRDRIRKQILWIETALADLRLQIASLLHDLEATRRERDELAKLLVEYQKGETGGGGDARAGGGDDDSEGDDDDDDGDLIG